VFGTDNYLWDWSYRQATSSEEGDCMTPTGWILPILVTSSCIIQQNILCLATAMGPITVSSTCNHEVVCNNITACISPPYALLTDYVDIVKHKPGREPYCDIHCDHCILTNCIYNSQPLD
jgi:hypothetical protein